MLYFNIEVLEKIRGLAVLEDSFVDKRFVDRNEFLELKKNGTED